jgi:prepilin-type processing-associated H-X9-DG protein
LKEVKGNQYTGNRGPFHHLDGANYLFCDGHVKWYQGNWTTGNSDKVWNSSTSFAVSGSDPTFQPY